VPAPPAPPTDRSPLARLATADFLHRPRVLVLWVAVLGAAIGATTLFGAPYAVDYDTPGSESAAATETLTQEFGGRSGETLDVVYRAESVTAPAVRKAVDGLLGEAGRLPGLQPGPTTRDATVSRDGRTAVVSVALDRIPDEVPAATGERLAGLAEGLGAKGVTVGLGGAEVGQVTGARRPPSSSASASPSSSSC
jgi:RND superfamily putative drug exporter